MEDTLSEKKETVRVNMQEFVRSIPRSLLLDMDAEKVFYPREFLEDAGRRNLLGLRVPFRYGGSELGWEEEIVGLEEVGVLGTSLACLYSLVSIVGEAINFFGSHEQKEKWLTPMVEGKITVAEALTEPRGGSDFFGTTTKATKEGDYYILEGQKRFVVGAEGADIFFVYARTDPHAPPHEGLSAFIVERCPELRVEHVYGLLGTRGGGTGRIRFDKVKVPKENLIGGENKAASIFYQMMIPERMTSAAGAVGLGRAALEIAASYSNRRKAFGHTIRKFQAVSFKVAESITLLDAARGLVSTAAQKIDAKADASYVRRLVSEAKKFSTETAWKVVNNAMQILGGIGYTNVYPIERFLRDARLALIWTGTNEIMDSVIQHEYFNEVLQHSRARKVEEDAPNALGDEKVYE